MAKKFITLLLLLCLAAAGCAAKQPTVPVDTPPAEFPTIEIRTETVRYRTEYISVNLNYPIINGLSDTAREEELNASFAAAAAAFKDNLETEATAWAKEAAAGGYEFRPYAADIIYDVPYNQNGLLSLRVTYGSYTGGAHGAAFRETLNLDTVNGETLHLRDFFAAEADYLTLVREEIARQIAAAPDSFFPGVAETLAVPEDRFYLTDGAVVVYFSEYELAPYAAGLPEFTVPAQRRL